MTDHGPGITVAVVDDYYVLKIPSLKSYEVFSTWLSQQTKTYGVFWSSKHQGWVCSKESAERLREPLNAIGKAAGLTVPQTPINPVTTQWDVLWLTSDAPAWLIKEVGKLLSYRYHPDNVETGNKEKFMRVREAVKQLLDT